MNIQTFFQLNYGVYITTTLDGERPVGCVTNSIMQITSTWSGTIRPRYTLEPGYNAGRMVSIRYADNCKVYTDLTYSGVTKLIFKGSEMVAGSIVILWGEK